MPAPQPALGSARSLRARRVITAGWCLLAALTFLAAFVLPFGFPGSTPVLSNAYTVGANNRVAAVALAMLSVLVAWVCWRMQLGGRLEWLASEGRMPRRVLWYGVLATSVFTATLGFFVVRAGHFYSDEGYFLTQLRTGLVFHGRLYQDFEFPYGPAYYAWPAMFLRGLRPLGFSPAAAYAVSLLVLEALGVSLLFYTVNALPIRLTLKSWAFALVTFGSLDPLFGLNYSVFRFVFPLALVVLLSRQRSAARAALVAGLGEIAAFAVSPELGIAFGGGALAYAIYASAVSGRPWLLAAGADAAGAIAFYGIGRHSSFLTMGKFAAGGFNIILEPVPHVFGLLIAVVALAPLAVAAGVRGRDRMQDGARGGVLGLPQGGMLVALYAASLGLLPAAIGRGDPLHSFFNGIGAYLLAFVAFELASSRWRRIGVCGVALIFLYTQAQDFHFYRNDLLNSIRRTPDPWDDPDLPARSGLSAAIGSGRVLFPWNAPLALSDRLAAAGQYQPGYFCVMALDAESERRKVAEMRSARLVMVPLGQPLAWQVELDNQGWKYRMRLGYKYRVRRAPFFTGSEMLKELKTNWTPVGRFGNYMLYRLGR